MLSRSYKQIFANSTYSLHGSMTGQYSKSFSTMNIRMSHYEVLGVKNSASHGEIKSAYYDKVKLFHPDHNHTASAEEDFKIVARAYETLKDSSMRQVYDSRLKTGAQFANEYNHSYNASNPYADFYTAKKTKSHYQEDDTFAYSTSYDRYQGNHRAEDYYRYKYERQAHSSSMQDEGGMINSLLMKIALLVGVFAVVDYWRKNNKRTSNPHGIIQAGAPMSIGQMDFETFSGWGRDDAMTPEKLQAEIKKKGFRIEYHDVIDNKAHDTKKAKRSTRRDKKIENMDKFLAKRNFQLQKSKV